MSMIEFRLPWPPSVNTYYVCIRSRKVLSKKGRLYKEEVKRLVSEAKLNYGIDTEVEVDIKLAPPRNGKWDGDNYVKALFDAMTDAGIWKDDSLVKKYSVEKLDSYAMGEVYITISPFNPVTININAGPFNQEDYRKLIENLNEAMEDKHIGIKT